MVSEAWVEQIRESLPELPDAKKRRFVSDYGLSPAEAAVLAEDRAVADYFERGVASLGDARVMAIWVSGELFRLMNQHHHDIASVPISPEALADLLRLVEQGTITTNTAKSVLQEMYATGQTAMAIVDAKGLAAVSDSDALLEVAQQVVAENPEAVERYLQGKEGLLGFLIGQVMKATRGKADPKVAREVLLSLLAG
jgi:aspartyl-tRNA(Asn)/glutamyl-tRNA(Gln) amidotransferase subunit B